MTEKTKPFTEVKPNKITSQIKSIGLLINSNSKSSKKMKFIGIKRKLFQKEKKLNNKNKNLSIEKPIKHFVFTKNNTNFANNDNLCIICLDKISFEEKHFLHCGHNFHCSCINHWINMGKSNCPICKQNIECNKSDFHENLINLEEENNENNFIIRNNNSNIMGDFLNILLIYLWLLFIFFMFQRFCFKVF